METEKTDMLLLNTNEDIILVAKPYCKRCMSKKLDYIKVVGEVSGNERRQLIGYGVRYVKIRCDHAY